MSQVKEVSLTLLLRLSYSVVLSPMQCLAGFGHSKILKQWSVSTAQRFPSLLLSLMLQLIPLPKVMNYLTEVRTKFWLHWLLWVNLLYWNNNLLYWKPQLSRKEWQFCCRSSQYSFFIYFCDLERPRRPITINDNDSKNSPRLAKILPWWCQVSLSEVVRQTWLPEWLIYVALPVWKQKYQFTLVLK